MSAVAEAAELCSLEGVAALFGAGFANKGPAASKPVSRRQVGLNIGKETSKHFRCPIANFALLLLILILLLISFE